MSSEILKIMQEGAPVSIEASKQLFIDLPRNYNKKVIYGIPKDTATRLTKGGEIVPRDSNGNPLTNAQLLWWFEHGSAARDIPERRLLGPVRDRYIKTIREKYFKPIAKALVEGKTEVADVYMEQLALFMETKCKAYFRDNDWEPNTEATLEAWKIDTLKKNKHISINDTMTKTTGIWTGEMRKSIRGLVVDTTGEE